MKKVLRFIGILLLVLIVAFLILCIIAPKETNLERSISIKASKEAVWEQMLYFKNWSNWSPWQEQDSSIKVTLAGVDGTPGSSYSWTSENSGEGSVTNNTVEGSTMKFTMHFIKPFEATPDGLVKVEDEGNGMTKATWTFHGENTFISGGMMKLMELTGMGLSKSYERGLQLLKDYVEKNPGAAPQASSAFDIQEAQFPGHTYASLRKTVNINMDDMNAFFSESFEKLGKEAGKRINGPASNLVYKWDEKNGKADMAAAFPVSGEGPVNGAAMTTVAPSKAYMIVYTGGYHGSGKAHEALTQHMTAKGHEMTMVVEEYIKGPGDEKDSTKYVTNIYYLIK